MKVTTLYIKNLLGFNVDSHDRCIESLIKEMQPALEYSIKDQYLSEPACKETIKLGMAEIIAGEFAEQLKREDINTSRVSLDLIQQGAARLAPYLKTTTGA